MPRTTHLDDQPQLPHLIATINDDRVSPSLHTSISIDFLVDRYTARTTTYPGNPPHLEIAEGVTSAVGQLMVVGNIYKTEPFRQSLEQAVTQGQHLDTIKAFTNKIDARLIINEVQISPFGDDHSDCKILATFQTTDRVTIHRDKLDSRDHIADQQRFEALVSPNHPRQSLGK